MTRRYITTEEQRFVLQRASACCEYCQSLMEYATQPFVYEHIFPISRGGKTELDNLALACGGCNGHKYNHVDAPDPIDGQVAPLYHPRQQNWLDHFCWNEDYTHIIGLTPTGRATVEALKMNRSGLVNMRQLLLTVGKHPPNHARK